MPAELGEAWKGEARKGEAREAEKQVVPCTRGRAIRSENTSCLI